MKRSIIKVNGTMSSSKNIGLVFIGGGILLLAGWWFYLMLSASDLPVSIKAAIVLVTVGVMIILASMSIESRRDKK